MGDFKVENVIVAFREEEEDILVEEVTQIARGTELLRDTHRHVGFCQKIFVTSGSRVKRVLTRAMSK